MAELARNTAPVDARISPLQAMNKALREALAEDERVFVIGEDIEAGTFGLTLGLLETFGPERIRNTPISESGIVGAAVGAAMCGMRPVVDLNIATFSYVAIDQLINQAAKNRYLFGAQTSVPAVFYMVAYHRSNTAAQHTDRPHPIFMGIPGFTIIAPTLPSDSYNLMKAAIDSPDPVLVIADMTTLRRRGPLSLDGEAEAQIGEARIARAGADVTLVAFFTLFPALAVAEKLAAEGISVEVIDPRTLAPLDSATILNSVRRTGRLVVADIAYETCSAASEVIALASEQAFDALKAAPRRVCTPMVHIPFSPPLEKRIFPDEAKIERAVRAVLSGERS
jgi:acetoin:2,6-dichlorophenolindophenol oxidoreductase subunit beta